MPAKKNITIYLLLAGAIAFIFAMQIRGRIRYQHLVAGFADESVIGRGRPVLLLFGAVWCPHCRTMANAINGLAKAGPLPFAAAYIDVDKNPSAAQKYNVQGIPLMIFFDAEGNELARQSGAISGEQFLEWWTQLEGAGGSQPTAAPAI